MRLQDCWVGRAAAPVNGGTTMRVKRYLACALGFTVVAGPLAASISADAAQAAPCAAAAPSAPAYAKGAANTVVWQFSGGGHDFKLEWSHSSATAADGSFVTPEGSIPNIPLSATSQAVSGLSEAQHFYHVRTDGGALCSNTWSPTVSTIQDATAPLVTITSSSPLINQVTVSGTAVDWPAASAPSGSGATSVTVGLANAMPMLGSLLGQPAPVTVPVAPDGTWSATFHGTMVGAYTASATGTDRVGNVSSPLSQSVIVVAMG
jgi:hypothetical protein